VDSDHNSGQVNVWFTCCGFVVLSDL